MSPKEAAKKIDQMAPLDRLGLAKAKTDKTVDHLLELLALHESNRIVVYTPTLSSQIPTSHAANAFNVFQGAMLRFEIIRLCALWSPIDLDSDTIPTIAKLIDNPEVLDLAIGENAGSQVELARDQLKTAIAKTWQITASARFVSLFNLRNKHLAHSLSITRQERKVGVVPPVKYGDERDLLNETLRMVEHLHCWLNGTGFDFEDSREISRKYADALWTACTFKIAS